MADKLLADGVSPATPVAVLEKGTRADSRAMRTLLADLGGLMARERVKSPALIVVGEVVLRSNAEEKLARLAQQRSAEHTSVIQSLMSNSYAVFRLNKNKQTYKSQY